MDSLKRLGDMSVVREGLLVCLMLSVATVAFAQEFTMFFPAGEIEDYEDKYGNLYSLGPKNAIEPTPIGSEATGWEDVFFEEDNLWSVCAYIGVDFLVSNAPGWGEDAPELTVEITMAHAGKYEVILHFLESSSARGASDLGDGPIQAALGDGDLVLYSAHNSVEASGGTGPSYPVGGGGAGSGMWWYTGVLGEVEVAAGEKIVVRVDDTPFDQFDLSGPGETTFSFT